MTAVSGVDLDGALSDLAANAVNPWLARCRPRAKGDRLTLYRGGVARVYPVVEGDRTYALRFWTAAPDGLEERYHHLARFQKRVRVPCLVNAHYLAQAVRVGGIVVPALRMDWVEGQRLGRFLDAHHRDAAAVEGVASAFADAVRTLHAHGCSHGDLQDGNILVERRDGGVTVRLVDYDTFHLPSLGTRPNQVTALPDYQHPALPEAPVRSAADDHFSELVIYLSLRAIAQDPTLWRPGTDARLILTRGDYLAPDGSPTFARLLAMGPEIRRLALTLRSCCGFRDIRHIPPLEAVLEQRASVVAGYFGIEAMRRDSPPTPATLAPRPALARPAAPPPPRPEVPLPASFERYFAARPPVTITPTMPTVTAPSRAADNPAPNAPPPSAQPARGQVPVPAQDGGGDGGRVVLLVVLLLVLAAMVAFQYDALVASLTP